MGLVFHNGQLLFSNSLLAMDPACCCNKTCCCNNILPENTSTLYAHVAGGTISCCITLSASGASRCGSWSGSIADIGGCTDTPIPLSLTFYCYDVSQGCNGYRLLAAYPGSGCINIATTIRTPTSCTCSTFSVVFEIPPPSSVAPATSCDCPEAGSFLQVTVNQTPC